MAIANWLASSVANSTFPGSNAFALVGTQVEDADAIALIQQRHRHLRRDRVEQLDVARVLVDVARDDDLAVQGRVAGDPFADGIDVTRSLMP